MGFSPLFIRLPGLNARIGLKPQITYDLPATREAVGEAFGQKVAARFVENSLVPAYAVVLHFHGSKVIVSGEIKRALRKVKPYSGQLLLIAQDLTVEARQIAVEAQYHIITLSEFFGWTDLSYQNIRQKS